MKDTYFFNYEEAKKEAKKQNKIGVFDDLQICYYNGEKKEDNIYENLIPLPIEKFYDTLKKSKTRQIEEFVFDDTIAQENRVKLKRDLLKLQKITIKDKVNLGNQYRQQIKQQSINFTEPLRVLFVTTRCTTVLQYVSKNLSDAFDTLGYETFLSMEENATQSWYGDDDQNNFDFTWHLENIYKFNPHIVVNLDWINNTGLNDDMFNFIWFQDPMPILYDNEEIVLRERDYIFTLLNQFTNALEEKGVDNHKIMLQHFATNPKIFFEKQNIKKDNKIVFLGSAYNFDQQYNIPQDIHNAIIKDIEENKLSYKVLDILAKFLDIDTKDFNSKIIPSYIRKQAVIWMCQLKDIDIEVYGSENWLDIPEVAPYYKGHLEYGEKMNDIYNNAKYALVAHSEYRYQQRLFEISACNCIPIVYEGTLLQEEFHHIDNILNFSTSQQLQECIGQEPVKSSKEISQDISYEKLAQKIINIVKKKIS